MHTELYSMYVVHSNVEIKLDKNVVIARMSAGLRKVTIYQFL